MRNSIMYYDNDMSVDKIKKLKQLYLALQGSVHRGQALIVLDGLDAIPVSEHRCRITNLVENFVDTHIQTPSHTSVLDRDGHRDQKHFLVPVKDLIGVPSPSRGQFAHYTIKPMNMANMKNFVYHWFQAFHFKTVHLLSLEVTADEIQQKSQGRANRLKLELADPNNIG
ncbi:unnamed protein product [Didymodactylos carnosus]|uniref:Uncharacterized protein n=1 Tax=Didymodactylos carnosus TaxID=1234261 RepID=A0A814ZH14_9BILA|nr:unnamed protein product [Didymodactylos carnosus]CAF1243483.1 unnamed protein product [Didymodactylos carnosus]CAF3731975.1 unnamed protein product [Didymodactylos carnosus]CAF4007894.1 unnamed protein product [Didymodactylos carnosus]